MALSAFDEKAHPPGLPKLRAVLGRSAGPWDELISSVAAAHAPIVEAWSFAGAKYGWSLKLKRKDRVVLYMTPQHGYFLLGVVLGEKAAKAAHASGLPQEVLALIDSVPHYAEGRGIRLPITTRADLATALALAAVKMAT